MEKNELDALLKIATLQLATSQSKLRALRGREAKLRSLLLNLSNQGLSNINTANIEEVSIIEFQNEISLRRWIDGRRIAINTEIAQVRALIGMQLDIVSKHYSRKQALHQVADERQKSDQLRLLRASYYGP